MARARARGVAALPGVQLERAAAARLGGCRHGEALGAEHGHGGGVHVSEEDALHTALEQRDGAARSALPCGRQHGRRHLRAGGWSQARQRRYAWQRQARDGPVESQGPRTPQQRGERPQPPWVGEQREQESPQQAVRGRAAPVALDLRPGVLDQPVIANARRARGDARHAAEAVVEVVDHRCRQRRRVTGVHQHDSPPRRVGLFAPERVGRARREAEATVHAVRDQRRLGRSLGVPRRYLDRPLHQTVSTPGAHTPAGSKRSFTRRIRASAPSSCGPQTSTARRTSAGASSTTQGAGASARRSSVSPSAARSSRVIHESPSPARPDHPRVQPPCRLEHVGELALQAGHADHCAGLGALGGALLLPQLAVGFDDGGAEAVTRHRLGRRARRCGRCGATEARQERTVAVLPADVEALQLDLRVAELRRGRGQRAPDRLRARRQWRWRAVSGGGARRGRGSCRASRTSP